MLRRIVSEIVTESMRQFKQGRVATSHGESVEPGSAAHIDDLTRALDTLIRLRDHARRGSAARKVYSDAVARTREQLRAAKRRADARAFGR